MKYTVLGFQQEKLIKNSITLEEALVLRAVKDLYSSDRMDSIIRDDKRYIWVKQSYFLEQIPIVGSMSKLKRMLSKLCKNCFLESVVISDRKGITGKFYYVKHTKKLDDLEDYDKEDVPPSLTKCQNDTRPSVKMTLDQVSKRPNKDTSLSNPSISYNKDTLSCTQDDVNEIINYLNDKIGSNFKSTTNKTVSSIRSRFKEGFTLDDFYIVIDKKSQEWINDDKMNIFLRPLTLFGPKFESYLNQKDINGACQSKEEYILKKYGQHT